LRAPADFLEKLRLLLITVPRIAAAPDDNGTTSSSRLKRTGDRKMSDARSRTPRARSAPAREAPPPHMTLRLRLMSRSAVFTSHPTAADVSGHRIFQMGGCSPYRRRTHAVARRAGRGVSGAGAVPHRSVAIRRRPSTGDHRGSMEQSRARSRGEPPSLNRRCEAPVQYWTHLLAPCSRFLQGRHMLVVRSYIGEAGEPH
jgi:hypothetical protein